MTATEEQIVFLSREGAAVGLIFYPGARVEAEAYAVFLHEIASWGYAVFVSKMPLGLAVFGKDRAATLISASPAIQRWVLGDHSMGGGVACDFVATHMNISGLLLYGTFCGYDLSQRRDLAVTLIYGTHEARVQILQASYALFQQIEQ